MGRHIGDDDIEVDPLRQGRHASPHEVGVLSVPVSSRTANRGRWYYQDQWSAWTKRRVMKHLEQFSTREEFVEFAIEAARIRHLPPPNYRGTTPASEYWSVERIVHALDRLLAGKTLGSNALNFFNAAIDELEGFQWGDHAPTVLANGDDEDEPVVAIVEHMAGVSDDNGDERSEELTDLRRRYVLMLIVKAEDHDGLPPDDLLDRIERQL